MRAPTNLDRFKSILPYASEMFGVYQPMIGWRSKRQLKRTADSQLSTREPLIAQLADRYSGNVNVKFNADHYPELRSIEPGTLAARRLSPLQGSELLARIAQHLRDKLGPFRTPRDAGEWADFVDPSETKRILNENIFPTWQEAAWRDIRQALALPRLPGESTDAFDGRVEDELAARKSRALVRLERESASAGMLADLLQKEALTLLQSLFYGPPNIVTAGNLDAILKTLQPTFDDPFATFDPRADVKDVSLSPIGIVHLFRQYFFEFDTFLGTPVSHVWLSPGSSVELIETSSRKITTERTVEAVYETIVKSERTTTEQDDVSDAIRQENRNDSKLGFSMTVNQSWPTGDATATGSLNLDGTQMTAREQTHKRMRQQSDKLSTEIRQSYKSTFKTVAEVTDTSSKRYLLANSTKRLINYELRRKMRQVGVQVQDIGTYLCWQTFVDEPGQVLGLANLVHIAQPPDLAPQPNQKEIAPPPSPVQKPFTVNTAWTYTDGPRRPHLDKGYIPLGTIALPIQIDPGYEIQRSADGRVALYQTAAQGEDFNGVWGFVGAFMGTNQLEIGLLVAGSAMDWDKHVDFTLTGEVSLVPTAARLAEIAAANAKIIADRAAATRAEQRAQEEAFYRAAKERIEQASAIKPRKFEELREEERTVVYRALIRDLMTSQLYNLPDRFLSQEIIDQNRELRHVLSELINAVFDIDKMLYFVAPEWWKPRRHYSQFLGRKAPTPTGFGKASKPTTQGVVGNEMVVNWADNEIRTDNYYMTNASEPARLGSSLGWLLQLDGDNHRNAFLNAPWVKAVIPVRPGKEQAAINWLQNVNVEGTGGLDMPYAAPDAELVKIHDELLAANPDDPVADHPTIADTIRYLCQQVSKKHAESVTVRKFPGGIDVPDDDRVSSTPVERVFEHGFYPLQGGFRVNPQDPDPHNPDTNFQVFDQWVEVLPTDQIVPVEVAYDPITGRQVPLPEVADAE
jgi:hypothetical protein